MSFHWFKGFSGYRWNGSVHIRLLPHHRGVGLWLHRCPDCHWGKLAWCKEFSLNLVHVIFCSTWKAFHCYVVLIYSLLCFLPSIANASYHCWEWCTEEKVPGKDDRGASYVCKCRSLRFTYHSHSLSLSLSPSLSLSLFRSFFFSLTSCGKSYRLLVDSPDVFW